MSQIVRENRFTVRLSDDEKSDLEHLSDQLKLDKSATVRHALKLLATRQTHLRAGVFTTLNQQHHIQIRLINEESIDD